MDAAILPKADAVDRAQVGLNRAISRLIALLKGDDPATGTRALDGLLRLGPEVAVRLLAAEMAARRRDAPLRRRIVAVLLAIGSDERARRPALAALLEAREVERDATVLMAIDGALARLDLTAGDVQWLIEHRPAAVVGLFLLGAGS
jgi:hypothetical protein